MIGPTLHTVVIPCGGAGSRLAPAIGALPKVLAPVAGRPLLAHLLEGLARAGAERVILLAGVGADRVRAEARRLAPDGLTVESIAEPAPLGTAGALSLIDSDLPERFALAYGDVFADLDWRRLWQFANEHGGLGTLVCHRSSHPEDSDTLVLDDDHRVIGWRCRGAGQGVAGVLTNAAVAVFHRDLLRRIPRGRSCDLTQELLPALVDARSALFGYTTSEYVCDLGTPARLEAVDRAVRSGKSARRAELVLLDRDGVLTTNRSVADPGELTLLPGAASAVRALNRAGIRVCLVTNQAVVARGLCSAETLEAIHARLRALLAAEGAEVDAIHACPHHPETHFAQGVPELRGPCRCRKPSTGMVDRALAAQGVAAWRAVVVGDATIDLQLAHNAGLAALLVETGEGGRDGRYPARPIWSFADLGQAAAWLIGPTGNAEPKAL